MRAAVVFNLGLSENLEQKAYNHPFVPALNYKCVKVDSDLSNFPPYFSSSAR